MNHQEHCDALAVEVERFATIFESSRADAEVVACPGWAIGDVAEHLGMIHRWAEQLVLRRAAERLSFDSLGLNPGPVTPEWIRLGGSRLLDALRAADPDQAMWAWGPDHHVRFWSRRQLHETLVHRMDVEMAADLRPGAAANVAIDAIDEFLSNLALAPRIDSRVRELRGDEARIAIRELDAGTCWTVTLINDSFQIERDARPADAEISGPPVDLLLALYRRRGPGQFDVRVDGDHEVVNVWLEHSAFT